MTDDFLEEFGNIMDMHDRWEDLYYEADKLLERQETENTLELLTEAYEIASIDDSVPFQAKSLERMGYANMLLDNPEKAEEHFKASMNLCCIDPREYMKTMPEIPGLPEKYVDPLKEQMKSMYKGYTNAANGLARQVLERILKNYGALLEKQNRQEELATLKENVSRLMEIKKHK